MFFWDEKVGRRGRFWGVKKGCFLGEFWVRKGVKKFGNRAVLGVEKRRCGGRKREGEEGGSDGRKAGRETGRGARWQAGEKLSRAA